MPAGTITRDFPHPKSVSITNVSIVFKPFKLLHFLSVCLSENFHFVVNAACRLYTFNEINIKMQLFTFLSFCCDFAVSEQIRFVIVCYFSFSVTDIVVNSDDL